MPCIIFWNRNHFVVLRGFKNNYAYLNDPARGAIKVSMQEFQQCYSGIVLKLSPTEAFKKEGEPKKISTFIFERMKGAVPAIILSFVIACISTLTGILTPIFSQYFLDNILVREVDTSVWLFFVLLILFSVFCVVMSFVSTTLSKRMNGRLEAIGSASYFWKVLHLPMEFFSQRMTGDILQRQNMNAQIAETIVDKVSPLLIQIISLIFYLVLMIQYSPVLSFIGVLSVSLNLCLAMIATRRRINMTRMQMQISAKLASATVSGISMIETIKSSGVEMGYFHYWADIEYSSERQALKINRMNIGISTIISIISTLAGILVMMSGIYLIIEGSFTIGMFVAFQAYLTSFLLPAQSIITTVQSMQEIQTSVERIEDVMEYPIDTSLKNAKQFDENGILSKKKNEITPNISDAISDTKSKLKGNLVMNNVTFGYSPLAKPLITDFSLNVDAGKSVAIVGKSGSGKSTVAKLISGLYQSWSGDIRIDDIPLEEIDRDILTGSLAVVDQDITIFEDTIANNIRMWDSSILDFEIILAARDAQIHDAILEKDQGYQHILKDGGKDFSGGQRQRLEIARVLAQDPTIVILDEATSALDAKTEAAVIKAIRDRGITCIVIAHRLSSIRDCDEIIVLDNGTISERGTHEELFNNNGLYTQLISNE